MKVVIDDYRLEKMDSYTEPLEAKIKRQAAEITRLLKENAELKKDLEYYHTGTDTCDIESARATGQQVAWELAQNIVCRNSYNLDELREIFGCYRIPDMFEKHTYSEAATKVAEWKKAKEEICVGDVVTDGNGESAVVTFINDIGTVFYIWNRGVTKQLDMEKFKKLFTKTGRRIDVDAWLAQIGGDE